MSNKWSEEEKNFLINNYNNNIKECFNKIDKNKKQIYKKAKMLNLTKKRTIWTKKEEKILKKFYLLDAEKCFQKIDKSKRQISSKANIMGLKRRYVHNWTKEEIYKFYIKYPICTQSELKEYFPNIKPSALHEFARKRGLKKIDNGKKSRKGDASPLLDENFLSYYWAGFIAADGHISQNEQLVVALSSKDRNHLEKLSSYIKTPIYDYIVKDEREEFHTTEFSRICLMHKGVIGEFSKKFDFNNLKTKKPPSIDIINKVLEKDDNIICFFIGLIDGDGSINKSNKLNNKMEISIECDLSWFNLIKYISIRVQKIFGVKRVSNPYISRKVKNNEVFDYTKNTFRNQIFISKLKKFAVHQEIPYMDRKWRKIL